MSHLDNFDIVNTSVLVSNISFDYENLTETEFNISIRVMDNGEPPMKVPKITLELQYRKLIDYV